MALGAMRHEEPIVKKRRVPKGHGCLAGPWELGTLHVARGASNEYLKFSTCYLIQPSLRSGTKSSDKSCQHTGRETAHSGLARGKQPCPKEGP